MHEFHSHVSNICQTTQKKIMHSNDKQPTEDSSKLTSEMLVLPLPQMMY
jgi:hypothetical protein